jgi:argininosuccinate synthase
LDAFFASVAQPITGTARIKLYRGNCRAVGAKSPHSLHVPNLASFTMGAEYDSTDATGFIRLFGLPMRVGGVVQRKMRKTGKATSRRTRRIS